jgi:hypothetical protein
MFKTIKKLLLDIFGPTYTNDFSWVKRSQISVETEVLNVPTNCDKFSQAIQIVEITLGVEDVNPNYIRIFDLRRNVFNGTFDAKIYLTIPVKVT